MITNQRTLGPNEAKTVLSFREQDRTIVRAADVIEILGKESTARKVIHNLLRKGWLTRLIAGRYLFIPPEYGPENRGENNVLALAAAAELADLAELHRLLELVEPSAAPFAAQLRRHLERFDYDAFRTCLATGESSHD